MKYLQNILIILFWLIVWHVAALLVDNSILAVTPWDTLKAIADLFKSEEFLTVIAGSMGRIWLGLFVAVISGFVIGIFSYKVNLVERLMKPVVVSVKAIPVASIVVLLLIWQGSEMLSVWISFLISFPIIYTNIMEGMKSTDKKLLEMAEVFGISAWNKIWYIYRPCVKGYILGGMKLAAGMSVKAGVAAEIIGLPKNSFGERLYMAKIYLATEELFAWTVIIVVTAFVSEKLIVMLTDFMLKVHIPYGKRCYNRRKDMRKLKKATKSSAENNNDTECVIRLTDISKKYGENTVFSHLNMELKAGQKVGIMAPSGRGKTTLFRIILGLEKADTGTVKTKGRIAAVFQETLLCEKADLHTNMRITGASDEDIRTLTREIFSEEHLDKPVEAYSLGMKRRCSIIRALTREGDILIMDEPFASIDDENRRRAADVIRERTKDKTVIIFTHNEEDICLIGGSKLNIFNKIN